MSRIREVFTIFLKLRNFRLGGKAGPQIVKAKFSGNTGENIFSEKIPEIEKSLF